MTKFVETVDLLKNFVSNGSTNSIFPSNFCICLHLFWNSYFFFDFLLPQKAKNLLCICVADKWGFARSVTVSIGNLIRSASLPQRLLTHRHGPMSLLVFWHIGQVFPPIFKMGPLTCDHGTRWSMALRALGMATIGSRLNCSVYMWFRYL